MKAKTLKRTWLTILLVMLVAFSAACSSGGNGNNPPSATPNGNGEGVPPGEIVELKAITMGVEPATGLDTFYEQLDALTIPDLGMKIRFDFVPWGDEKNQISRMIAAKEYDIYVGGVWTDFVDFAAKNAFANLSPLLDEVPDLVEHYRGGLDRVLVGGNLYGIPQLITPGGGGEGLLYREDLRKEWGLPEITDLATVEQYLYKAKEEFPDVPMINDKRLANNIWMMTASDKYLQIVQNYAYASVDEPFTAISMYDTPEYKAVLAIAKKWYDDGIIAHDILAAQGNSTSDTLELMKANKKPLEFNNHFFAVANNYIPPLVEAHPDYEYGWFEYYPETAPVYLPRMSADSLTMISIGAHSKHVLTALKFIEKAHTDQTYYNLLMYGVEGEHYKLDDDGYIHYEDITAENRKPAWTGLSDGYMNLPTRYPGNWQDIHDSLQEKGIARAEAGGVDPYEGFSFDTSSLASELSQMEQVNAQYIQPLAVGMTDDIDSDLETVKTQLKNAGFETYMSVLQEQLDAFSSR